MAEVKDGDIVFEYPDDMEVSGNKLPDEKEVFIQKEKNELKVETKEDDIDLEIEDVVGNVLQDLVVVRAIVQVNVGAHVRFTREVVR